MDTLRGLDTSFFAMLVPIWRDLRDVPVTLNRTGASVAWIAPAKHPLSFTFIIPRETSMRPRFPSKWAAAVAAGCLSRAPAAADTVNLTFEHTTRSPAVSVNVKGTSVTGTPGPYYWQESNAPAGSPFPNPTTTFCVELTQHISTGHTYTYTETPLAATPGVNATEATLISELWGAHFNTAWESSSFTGSSASTAFQLALWELVY